jgi:hypothetical protein
MVSFHVLIRVSQILTVLLPVSETLGTDQVARGRCQVDFTFSNFCMFLFLLIELNKTFISSLLNSLKAGPVTILAPNVGLPSVFSG